MADQNDPQHISTNDARSGSTPHMTRYILAISLIAIIVIFGIYLAL